MAKKLTVVRKPTAKETGEFADAAGDIQKVLTIKPPLDLDSGEDALKKELKSLLPNIQEGDDLAVTTWVTLKKLGWKPAGKSAKTTVAEKVAAKKSEKETLSPTKRIKVLVKEDAIPGRKRKFVARFAKYTPGLTVAEAMKKHITEKDILWDIKDGFISVY